MKIEIGQAYRDTDSGFAGFARGYMTRGNVDHPAADCIVMLAQPLRPDGKCGEVRHIGASALTLVDPASVAPTP